MTLCKHLGASLSLLLAGLLTTASATAENCYILVHGHGVEGHIKQRPDNQGRLHQPALDYWSEAYFDEYQGGDFIAQLRADGGHYGVVGYNSTDEAGLPYWHDSTAGEIARQILTIRSGAGDGYQHADQCRADDTFWVVAHSQGATQMVYIAGNAVPGSPYYNRAYSQMDSSTETRTSEACTTSWWGGKNCETVTETVNVAGLDEGNAVTVDFDGAIDGVAAILTTGGAITGTEGADRVCNGNWFDNAINDAFLGKSCAGVRYLQTNDVYAVRNYVGTNLAAPLYTIGGYAAFPGMEGASSAMLNGEDDGYINLASQMNCAGSAKRNLYSDLHEYETFWGVAYGSPIFTCDNDHKGTARSYNLASLHTDHDAQRNGGLLAPDYTVIADGLGCGAGKNSAGRIAACTQ
ncbi:hypothetical protein [Microbulbifer taiwanensis]|uniref:Uncharacterized protein n=1 Tax=Microbulbifer taiwanensis TaxID=986746 RepID=A0ABW1YSN7_9GAMM|nr:hypothetical protein [Microbulbifer taiwanensis]